MPDFEGELIFKVDKVVETKNDDQGKVDKVVTTLIPVGDTNTKLKLTIIESADGEGGSMSDDIGVNLSVGEQIKVSFKEHIKQTTL